MIASDARMGHAIDYEDVQQAEREGRETYQFAQDYAFN